MPFCLFEFPASFRDFAVPERHCFHSHAIRESRGRGSVAHWYKLSFIVRYVPGSIPSGAICQGFENI